MKKSTRKPRYYEVKKKRNSHKNDELIVRFENLTQAREQAQILFRANNLEYLRTSNKTILTI